MRSSLSLLIDFAPFLFACLYLLFAPFNKVEESFQTQAAHDILFHSASLDLSKFDHVTYPGVVPRTFLGSAALAVGAALPSAAVWLLGLPKIFAGVCVRLALCWAVCSALSNFLHAARRTFGGRAASAAAVAALVSPHFLFASTRMFANVFALVPVTLGSAAWLDMLRTRRVDSDTAPRRSLLDAAVFALTAWRAPSGELVRAVVAFVFAFVWFRCDVIVLLVPVALSWLVGGRATMPQLVVVGAAAGVLALSVSAAFDSPLWSRTLWPEGVPWSSVTPAPPAWRHILWPEGVVLYANTVKDVSKNFGAEPWYWYFTSLMTKGVVGAVLLAPFALLPVVSNGAAVASSGIDSRAAEILLPTIGFVALYSRLAHKEMRFLYMSFPLFFLTAGIGAAKIWGFAERTLGWTAVGSGVADRKQGRAAPQSSASSSGAPSSGAPPLRRRGSIAARPPSANAQRVGGGGVPAARRNSPTVTLLRLAVAYSSILFVIGCALGSAVATALYVAVSARNYPGGVALARVYTFYDTDILRAVKVNQTGVDILPWSRAHTQHDANAEPQLPPCPEGDVTGSTRFTEWVRQCFTDQCPRWMPWTATPDRVAAGVCVAPGDARLRRIRIHIDNLAATTGVSRFSEGWREDTWVYDKTEGLGRAEDFKSFDFVIVESANTTAVDARRAAGFSIAGGAQGEVQGSPSIKLSRSWPFVKIETTTQLYIMVKRPGN